MKCKVKGCDNEASKAANLYGFTALCDRHLTEAQKTNLTSKVYGVYRRAEVPNITVFGNDCESQDRKVRELEAQGYVVIEQENRKVGDWVEMRFDRTALSKAQSDISKAAQSKMEDSMIKALSTGAVLHDTGTGKSYDRNQFTVNRVDEIADTLLNAGKRDRANSIHNSLHTFVMDEYEVNEMVMKIRATPFGENTHEQIINVLKEYGIIGGAK